jgi:hypothetical protein
MPISTNCTHCQNPFRLADKFLGKTVKCSQCGQPFEVVARESPADVPSCPVAKDKRIAAKPLAASPPGRRLRDEDDDDWDDRPVRPKRRVQESSNKLLLIGLGAGVLVLLLVAGTFAAFWSLRRAAIVNMEMAQAAERAAFVAPPMPPPPQMVKRDNPIAPPKAPDVEPPVRVEPIPQPKAAAPKPDADGKPRPAPVGPKLAPGAKITVRAIIDGSPPDHQGDFNKHVTQNLEIALRNVGYEPVPDGGLILEIRASLGPTGKSISVRNMGPSPPPKLPRPPVKPGTKPAPLIPPREQEYALEQVTASLVLSDANGSALWKRDQRFASNIRLFRTDDPAREMRQQIWQSFESWTRAAAVASWKE